MDNSNIHIPYDVVEKHIQCAICLSVIRGAVLTPCGHRYCSRCITEWVKHGHRCPCCNSILNSDQFYYDVQFDVLVDEVLQERDKAEQTLFDKMLSQDPKSSVFEETTTESPLVEIMKTSVFEETTTESPLVEIMKKHMKSSFLSHKQYFDKLRDDYRRKINSLENGLHTVTSTDVLSATGDHIDSLKETMLKNLEESESLVAKAFDRYLTENVPRLSDLPITVSVYVADKDIRLMDIVIKLSDRLDVLKPILEATMLARSDEIISWSDEGNIQLLFGPLSKSSTYNIADTIENIQNLNDVHQLSWDSRPVFQFQMCPGSEIVLHKVFTTERDLSYSCFVNTYVESEPQQVDYFQCQSCNLKWICKSCTQLCHKGHDMVPFALKHTPTWACCYCSKKVPCKIRSK